MYSPVKLGMWDEKNVPRKELCLSVSHMLGESLLQNRLASSFQRYRRTTKGAKKGLGI